MHSTMLALVREQDGWLVPKMWALPLFGPDAMQPGIDAAPVVMGLVVLIGVGTCLGALFGWAIRRARAVLAMPVGGLAGLALWWAGTALLWSRLPDAWRVHVASVLPPWDGLAQCALFGLCTGFGVTAFSRRIDLFEIVDALRSRGAHVNRSTSRRLRRSRRAGPSVP
jgi:hypothetical protein